MKRPLIQLTLLAASIAGLVACDQSKQVRNEAQDLNETKQEAVKEQAELQQEHQKEQAELRQEETREIQREQPGVRPIDSMGTHDDPAERAQERAELARDQAEERADLAKNQNEKIREEKKDVVEAKQEANEQRAEIVKDSREELTKLDQRAAELRNKVVEAKPEDKAQVTSALSGWPTQRREVERDIEALNSVKEANLDRAKTRVEKKLSALDNTLDRAESRF
jgi:hypothetical protein